jgi:hypothetical protein
LFSEVALSGVIIAAVSTIARRSSALERQSSCSGSASRSDRQGLLCELSWGQVGKSRRWG